MRLRVALMVSAFLFTAAFGETPVGTAPLPDAAADAPVADWADIETVVVHAHAPGPLMWRLSKGNSEIWLIGTVAPLPKDFAWNKTVVTEKIIGAKMVYLPAQANAGGLGIAWFLMTHWSALALPDGQKMQDMLPTDWRVRYDALVKSIGQDPKKYETRKPIIAAVMLQGDYRKARQWSNESIAKQLEAISDAHNVKVRPLAEYDANPMLKEMLQRPPVTGTGCLEAVVADAETEDRHAVLAADAWAVGDIAGLRAHYSESHFIGCVADMSNKFGKLEARFVADAMKAIDTSLASPGKTVMMIDIGRLLRQQGIIAELSAKGIAVEQVGQ